MHVCKIDKHSFIYLIDTIGSQRDFFLTGGEYFSIAQDSGVLQWTKEFPPDLDCIKDGNILLPVVVKAHWMVHGSNHQLLNDSPSSSEG